jgi:hypothetical protein
MARQKPASFATNPGGENATTMEFPSRQQPSKRPKTHPPPRAHPVHNSQFATEIRSLQPSFASAILPPQRMLMENCTLQVLAHFF